MKERGILFRGEMVRAILDGRKTQTRRVIKPPPSQKDGRDLWFWDGRALPAAEMREHMLFRARFRPGDRLWVRETWAPRDQIAEEDKRRGKYEIFYRADDETVYPDDGSWRSSLHMPRWASRINLEVTACRVERVQEISQHDAKAEGVTPICRDPHHLNHAQCYVEAFERLWDSMRSGNDFSWQRNPWVRAITFKRL